jgi:predicted nuclease of predicted toxin-antitoxin system
MRFLIDNALSPGIAVFLRAAGHDALHVRDLDLQHAEDEVIFERAAQDGAILVSADTDFGTLLATRAASKPSVMLFRGSGSRRPEVLASLILANLSQLVESLEAGCVAIFEPSRVRVRALPIAPTR